MNLQSYKTFQLAIFSGIFIGFSYPPFVGALAWVGFIPLIEIWVREKSKNSFFYSALSALLANIISLYWIGLNSGAEIFPVLLSLIAAVLYLSFFWGLLGFILSTFIKKNDSMLLLIPFAWTGMELLRSYGALGFPWLNLSLTQSKFLHLIQIIDFTGNEGIGFLIMSFNVIFYKVLSKKIHIQKALFYMALLIMPILFYGNYKLNFFKTENSIETRTVAVLQPNIDPNLKWDSSYREQLYTTMDSLNAIAYDMKPDLVLWPESALPSYLRLSSVKNKYKNISSEKNIPSLIGTLDIVRNGNIKKVHNGSIYFGRNIEKMYYKIFLVPFAEYNPLLNNSYLKNFSYWDFGQGSFTPGKEFTTFPLDSILFSNIICYESSHPKISRNLILNGARFLTIQANDAWLANSSGVRQHFELARLRAIEMRTGIVRSANTGISGIIDPAGRVIEKIPFNTQKVFKNKVVLNTELSFFTKYGNIFSWLCVLFFLLFTISKCILRKLNY